MRLNEWEPDPTFVFWDYLRIFPTRRAWWNRLKCLIRRRHRWERDEHGFCCACDLRIQLLFADGWQAYVAHNDLNKVGIRFWRVL